MITSRRSYRLLRVLGSGAANPTLVQLCLDRDRSNLALARRELASVRVAEVAAPAIPEKGLPPAATPVPGLSGPPGTSAPAAAPFVPLPRRVVGRRSPAALPTPVPEEPPAALAPVLTQRWSTDQNTLRRLLGALRAMS